MANTFEVITKYMPKAVDKYFVEESKTVILENGSKFIDVDFTETGYVKIAEFLLDGLSNYYRTQELPGPSDPSQYAAYAGNLASGNRDGFAIGGTTVRWKIYQLQWCRGRQFRIDHISNEETGKIVTGGLFEEFNRTKVIPEVDACRFGVLADTASQSLGNLKVNETITATDESTGIIHRFNDANEWLVQHEVPADQQVIFVNPTIMTTIKNTKELNKFLTQEDFRNANGLKFSVQKYDGRPIFEVPSSRFFTNVMVTENGYQFTPSVSKEIKYMICSLKAVVPIRKIEWMKMYNEDLSGVAGFYGTMMNYLLYHGVIVPKNKITGVYVSVGSAGSASTKTNVLEVVLRTGDVTNAWKLENYFTMPSGLRGTVCYAATDAFTVGSSVTIDGSNIAAVAIDGQVVTAGTSLYYGLVDYRGVCIAKSGEVSLTGIKKSA